MSRINLLCKLAVLLPGLALLAFSQPVQALSMNPVSDELTSVQTTDYKGVVTRIDGNTYTVDTDKDTKLITITDSVRVNRGDKTADRASIKVNDKITFTVTDQDQVSDVKIDAPSDLEKYLPWIVMALGALLIALYVIQKSSKKGKIKTSV